MKLANSITICSLPRRRASFGRASRERGQTLIEFAVLAPMVIVLLAAIVTFGLALNARSSVQQAVREGARQVAVGVPVATAQALAAGNANDVLNPADVLFCYPMNGTSQGHVGDPVRAYIFKAGAEGYPYDIVKAGGIFKVLNIPDLTVRFSPRATTRLEKSVALPNSCPAGS